MGITAGKLRSEVVKKTDKYSILKKRSGKFAVLGANKQWINGEEKVQILVQEGMIKAPLPKKEEPASEAETPAES